jgi:hypothetical protein
MGVAISGTEGAGAASGVGDEDDASAFDSVGKSGKSNPCIGLCTAVENTGATSEVGAGEKSYRPAFVRNGTAGDGCEIDEGRLLCPILPMRLWLSIFGAGTAPHSPSVTKAFSLPFGDMIGLDKWILFS